jgi:hypothetical protein
MKLETQLRVVLVLYRADQGSFCCIQMEIVN